MTAQPLLFQPGKIGRLNTKNRLVMPPMVRNYANSDGTANDRYAAHIERIAHGGVGTIVLEASYVDQSGKGFMQQLGIHTDACVPGLRRLVDVAHRYGALIGPQLYHAGRQTTARNCGSQPVAPSAIADPLMNEMPRALSTQEVEALVQAFAEAARRAAEAGCDFVELHAAHGYLITQFLSPFTNQRNDVYGGSFENRLRFLLQIISAVRARTPGLAILVRLSADEMVPGGITLDETVRIAQQLEAAGIDALDISVGNYASYVRGMMIPPMSVPDGALLPFAERVRQAVKIPVIAVGKIRSPQLAEQALQQHQADFIAIGRSLLADPDWPNKAQAGYADAIRPCIACNQGCIDRLFNQQDVWCTVNPECGHEAMFIPMVGARRNIAVIGAGPAGMQAAITAAERGHIVTLFETEDHLGGQLIAAAAAPHRQGWQELKTWLHARLEQLGVAVQYHTTAGTAELQACQAEAVVLASGAQAARPVLPGLGHKNQIVARDLLEGKAKAVGRVVIAGGGCSGAQTAEYLAARGHDVTLVEKSSAIASDAPLAERVLLIGRLQTMGVQLMPYSRVIGLEPSVVQVETPTAMQHLPADTLVMCLGTNSCNQGLAEINALGLPCVVAGDALEPRKVTEAIAEGAWAILDLERQCNALHKTASKPVLAYGL